VAEGVGHGIAQLPKLAFQLLLHLTALAVLCPALAGTILEIVFTISHSTSHPSAGLYRLMMARATRRPSTAAIMMPPAYPAPSPQG